MIPRLGKGLQRVCDSCYNTVHCDPCSNLVEDSIEAHLQAKMLSNTIRVGVITSCDVIVQAIVQGLSIAMTGSPLGKEIDVECFPSPPVFGQMSSGVFGSSTSSPASSALPSGLQSRHSITPNSLSRMSMSRNQDSLQRHLLMESTPSPNRDESAFTPTASRYIRSDADSRARAVDKARLAYEMYQERFNVAPDFSVGVVFGVCMECCDGWQKEAGRPAGAVSPTTREDVPASSHESNHEKNVERQCGVYSSMEKVPSDLTCDASVIQDSDEGGGHQLGDCKRDDDRPCYSSSEKPLAYQDDASHVKMYQMFYWVVIFDGEKMNSSRSSSITLPPSLCAHIQKREFDFCKHNEQNRSVRQSISTNPSVLYRSPSGAQVTIFDCDIDVEEELVAAILREGSAASAVSSINTAHPSNVLAITNALSGGIVGWLTGGRITRASYLQSVIQLAYMPFQWKHLYEVTDV